jgi:hypothetical protein
MLRPIQDQPSSVAPLRLQDTADMMRLLRLFVTQVQSAGPKGVTLTANSALFQMACRMLEASPAERESTRTALMALRDLVWRVDSVRSVLASHDAEPPVAEAIKLLDTLDIHQFLRQEP